LTVLALFLFLLPSLVACRPDDPVLVVMVRDGLNGRPIRGARCALAKDQARTDEAGLCRLVRWTPGDVLRVSASGYQTVERVLEGLVPAGEPPEARAEVELYPDRVQGSITDRYTGQPVSGAEVRLGGQSATSGTRGEFVVLNPSFPFTLTVQALGYAPYRGSFATTTVGIVLRPNTLEGTVQDQYSDRPISGATVTALATTPLTATTDAAGHYRLTGLPEDFRLLVRARGYRSLETVPGPTTRLDIRLRPAFLDGVVRDGRDGRPIAQARVVWSGGYVHTGESGRFHLEDIGEPEVLKVLAPGFSRAVITVTDQTSVTVTLSPFAVQGIYITGFVAGTPDWFGRLLDWVDQTELNAVVIEVKDAYGAVTYDTQVPLAQELGLADPRFDIRDVLRQCKERGIYTIAYIVVFEDSRLADARPEWAIHNQWGGLWRNHAGLRWTDPYRREVWEYNVAIAREVAELGFDEVQFDYIRFPTDGDTSIIAYSEETSIERQYDAISSFVQYAYEQLAPTGAFISADVFGYAAWRKMWEQGQDISRMTYYLDYLCPMSYPSHYSPGELGCANPNACPYEIVRETVIRAHAQMTETQRALVRPWLQDFDLGSPPYGPEEVAAQIRAVWDGGGWGWCLWNAGNVYTPGVDYSPQD
jgi:hypothetical protein